MGTARVIPVILRPVDNWHSRSASSRPFRRMASQSPRGRIKTRRLRTCPGHSRSRQEPQGQGKDQRGSGRSPCDGGSKTLGVAGSEVVPATAASRIHRHVKLTIEELEEIIEAAEACEILRRRSELFLGLPVQAAEQPAGRRGSGRPGRGGIFMP